MKKKSVKVSMALELLLNKILFGYLDRPVFDSDKAQLGEKFKHVYSNYVKPQGTEMFEKHIGFEVLFELEQYERSDRDVIVEIILNDSTFIEVMMFVDGMFQTKRKESRDLKKIREHIISEIVNYAYTGNVNIYINWYFKLFFQELFHLEFFNKDFVSEKEYQNLYDRFTIARPLIEMS